MYIVNYTGEIRLPYDPDLLVWLQETYPYSRYTVKGNTNGQET